jgi:hypothetical protein
LAVSCLKKYVGQWGKMTKKANALVPGFLPLDLNGDFLEAIEEGDANIVLDYLEKRRIKAAPLAVSYLS